VRYFFLYFFFNHSLFRKGGGYEFGALKTDSSQHCIVLPAALLKVLPKARSNMRHIEAAIKVFRIKQIIHPEGPLAFSH